MSAITLFGAGRWGTALATHLAAAGRDITLWARRSAVAEELKHTRHHPSHLSDLSIPDSVTITSELETAASEGDLWGLAIPTPSLRDAAEHIQPHLRDDVTIVSLSKGLDPDTLQTPSQLLTDVFEALPTEQIGVLHGPSDPLEVGKQRPTTLVAAAPTSETAEEIQAAFMTSRLRVYSNTDVPGVEVGGATKNVLAVATGLSDAAGYGDNVRAALITRGLAEIRRLGHAMGGHTDTFSGLSGVGDLIVTCTNPKSLNRFVGEQLGAGKSLDEVREALDGVAVGIPTAEAVHALADTHDLEVPIMSAVYEMLFQNRDPDATIRDLITRPNKRENWLPEDLQEAASKSTFSTPLSQQNGASE